MDKPIEKLESRIDDMIKLCGDLRKENELLRHDQRLLRQEFSQLQDKNQIARKRVEHIVARLKSLED